MRKTLALSLALLPLNLCTALAQPTAQPTGTAPQVTFLGDLKVVSSVAVTDGGDLVFIGSDARVHRTDARGVEQWNFAVGDFGRAHPVITPQGTVIAASYDDQLYALDPTGKLLWKIKLDGDVFASPALRPDGSLIVATAGGTVYAVSPQGQIVWT